MSQTTQDALVVIISPSQSAFFAGELFSTTITFSNPAPATNSPSLHALHNLKTSQSAVTPTTAAGWPNPGSKERNRPPSASHLGLAEYATSYLDSDEIPPSPFFGSSTGTFPSSDATASSLPVSRSTSTTGLGGALRTPKSAAFPPTPVLDGIRSASGNAASLASTSTPPLPTRKGLIGTSLRSSSPPRESKGSSAGLYEGPRRPAAHGRAQSMAMSSPDLAGSFSNGSDLGSARHGTPPTPRSHGKSRLGGSLGGDQLAGLVEDRRRSGAQSPWASAPIREESPSPPASPKFQHSSTFPGPDTSTTTPSTSNPSLSFSSPPSRKTSPYSRQQTPNASALSSTVSLATSETTNLSESSIVLHNDTSFYGQEKNDTMESLVREDIDSKARHTSEAYQAPHSSGPTSSSFPGPQGRDRTRANSYAYGGADPYSSRSYPRNTFLHPPNTITLLWSFAHLEGTFEVEEALIKTHEFDEVKKSLLGGFGSAMGGGTLDQRKENLSWKDWIWGSGVESSGKRVGATLEERRNSVMQEKTVPTFSSPPSILGVDLVLEPGESKSYSFSIRIPADLPPSFRGKSIKFSYHIVVGTNRSTSGPTTRGPSKAPLSRVMKVPLRVYNHVGVTGARPFYDLTNPIVYHRDEATTSGVDDLKIAKRTFRPNTGRRDFEAYAAALLDSVVVSSPEGPGQLDPALSEDHVPFTMMESDPASRPEMSSRIGGGRKGVGLAEEQVGCKAAVEIVTRNSQKVSYDINKDGYMVASLTLVKSAYRLGETVNGSIVINSGDGRVLRVSARLETHELIETSISTKSAPQIRQITRRLHSEHHECTLDSARVGFALAIPSGAAPDFATSGVKLQWSVRLSFLVIPPSPDAPISPPDARKPQKSSTNALGAPPRHVRSKSFGYGFEPAVPLTLPSAPSILPTGAAHLMPVLGTLESSPSHTSYRGVPDLGFVPVIFSANQSESGPPAPGPLQRSAAGSAHKISSSLSSMRSLGTGGAASQQASVVLVPAKVDTVECSIPIKVYPGNTPFKPTVTIFRA